jgi:hypothetical protein
MGQGSVSTYADLTGQLIIRRHTIGGVRIVEMLCCDICKSCYGREEPLILHLELQHGVPEFKALLYTTKRRYRVN